MMRILNFFGSIKNALACRRSIMSCQRKLASRIALLDASFRWHDMVILIITITLFTFSSTVFADTPFSDKPDVKIFIKKMVKKHKFKEADLIALFNTVKIRPTVMKSIKAPLEQRPWYTYQMLFVTEWRIRQGVLFWERYQDVLDSVQKKYGVPASIIVATIGIETKYGQNTGEYPVIDALANISFSDNPRAAFFTYELEEFLLLTREQKVDPRSVLGSYAGAIGQPQFMPSSYRRYAVSFHGHTKIDLSHNEADVIASIANYYKQKGWIANQPTALPVSLLGKKYEFFTQNKNLKVVTRPGFAEYTIPTQQMMKNEPYKLIELQNYWGKEFWLGFHNFDVIKRYNVSDLYAMAVVQLSHYLEALRMELKDE